MISLVDAATLFQGSPRVYILDARSETEFSKGHIAGAHPFHWRSHTQPKTAEIPYALLPMEKIARSLAILGIQSQSKVVVYGNGDDGFGEEGWVIWLLTHLGHRGPIQLLRGGLEAWKAKGYPLSLGQKSQDSKQIDYELAINAQVMANFNDISPPKDQPQNPRVINAQLIDTRDLWERVRGKIPGAVSIHWKDFFAADGKSPLEPKKLRRLLEKKGIAPDKPCIYYCTGGIRSAWAWLVHTLAGFPTAQNYAGGMADYAVHTALKKSKFP